jgi:hypothetical protein
MAHFLRDELFYMPLHCGVLSLRTYQYPFDHRCQAMLCPDSTWMGDHPHEKCAVAWEGVGEDAEKNIAERLNNFF